MGLTSVRDVVNAPASATAGSDGAGVRTGLLAARVSRPMLRADMVARRKLYTAVDMAARRRLTVLSAGPGWGKTSTISAWAAGQPRDSPVAWLSVESSDDSLSAFWRAALHALRSSGLVPTDHPLAVLTPTEEMSPETMQATYRGLLTLPAPIVLVLDDFHVIEDQAVLDSLALVLRYELPLRLVLISRTDPVLPLHRLRLAGELSEITADDLAFTEPELAELAESLGLDLRPADLERIHQRTDGWPAGVRLAMLHLSRPGVACDLSGFGGSDRSIGEYFVAEVLDQQTPDMREFLLRTSVTDRICAELADAIVPGGRGQEHLEKLERSHTFVTALGPERHWYRYHPLLREMLQHLFARDHPQEYRSAHAAAAGWLARHGEPVAALQHTAVAEDWTLFSAVFVQNAVVAILGPDRRIVERLLAAVPFDQLRPTAPLAVCAWALAFLEGRFAAMSTHTQAARELLPSTPYELRPGTGAVVEMIACSTARARSDAAVMVTTASAALTQLDLAHGPFLALPGLRAVAANNLGVGLLWSGRPQEARPILLASARRLEETGLHLSAINAWGHLGLCELVEGRLDAASGYAASALSLAEPRGVTSRFELRGAHITRAYVNLIRAASDEADRSVTSGLAATDGADEPAPSTALYVCQALVAVSRGRVRAAQQALAAAARIADEWEPPSFLDDWRTRAVTETLLLASSTSDLTTAMAGLGPAKNLSPTAQVCLARMLRASGDLRGSESVARDACEPAADGGANLVTEVEAWLVRALVNDQLRRTNESQEYLCRALELARPQRLLRPFVVSGSARMAVLLEQSMHPTGGSTVLAREVLALLGRPESSTPEPEPLVEPLTDRELTILWTLPTMQTNGEIAAGLFISVNTVKAHLKALYRKLGVANRRDAVRRGRALGMLT